jgi:hypothetical protein
MEEKSKEEFRLWHQEMGRVRGQQYFTFSLDNGPQPPVCQMQTEQKG